MRNIKLVIEYDGSNYKGWQIQKDEPTVQGVIEEKLTTILTQHTRVIGAGRTDTGVHALNQVAHFHTTSTIDLETLHRGLNSLLPPDVVIKELTKADSDFHARYSAKSRVYQYLIWNGTTLTTFYRRYAWHVPHHLDREAMKKAAQCLVGYHDFASFKGGGGNGGVTDREIIRFTIKGRGGRWIIVTIEATAFLRHMVRTIMGTLVEVGKGTMTVEEFRDVLASKDRSKAGVPAPPQGLFLKEVKY